MFQFGYIPLLTKEGWLRHQSKVAKHRRAADGVVAQPTRFTNASRSIACERPPRPRLFSERIHFANGASTPPLQGGECTYPKSVSNMKWDTALHPQDFSSAGRVILPPHPDRGSRRGLPGGTLPSPGPIGR